MKLLNNPTDKQTQKTVDNTQLRKNAEQFFKEKIESKITPKDSDNQSSGNTNDDN